MRVIKVMFLHPVNIYLQDVPVISVRVVVILVIFSVNLGDFGNSLHPIRRPYPLFCILLYSTSCIDMTV